MVQGYQVVNKGKFIDIELENLNSIETNFFDLQNLIFHLCPNAARFLKHSIL